MKRLLPLIFALGILLNAASGLFSPAPVYATSTPEGDKTRRELFTFRQCLERSVIDEDDEIDGGWGDLFDNNEHEREVIVVGLDRDSGNGVQTCTTVIYNGIRALFKVQEDVATGEIAPPDTSDNDAGRASMQNWFTKVITGKTTSETGGSALPNGDIENRRKWLYDIVNGHINNLGGPTNSLVQARFTQNSLSPPITSLANMCFDFTKTPRPHALSDKDFRIGSNDGYAYHKDFDQGSVRWIEPGGFNNSSRIGDLELNYGQRASSEPDFNDWNADFYPIGADLGNRLSGFQHGAFADCEFVKNNKDLLFAGLTVDDAGQLINKVNGTPNSPPPPGPGATTPPPGSTAAEPECRSTGGFTIIICGAINVLSDSIQFVQEKVIIPFLRTDPLTTHDSNGNETPAFSIWKNLRNMANVLLVLVFFGIIFGQTIGIDAYTVKKVLPRLVIAVIAIQVSFYIAAIAIDITNVVGNGLRDIITAPLPDDAHLHLSGGGNFLAGGGATIGTLLGGLALANSLATGSFLAALAGLAGAMALVFLTLLFRQMVIILLAVLTPLAFAAWILPNTERFFKMWSSFFSRALMMYPLIILLFAAGDVFMVIALSATGQGSAVVQDLFQDAGYAIAAIASLIVPMALIPLTFSVAGNLISQAAGFVNKGKDRVLKGADGKSGAIGRIKGDAMHRRAEIAAGMGVGRQGGAINRLTRSRALQAGARPGMGFSARSRAQAVTAFNMESRAAGKDLEDKGLTDATTLAHFADVGADRRAFDNRIQWLRNNGQVNTAERLESMRNFVGKQAYQAAALRTAAAGGQGGEIIVNGTRLGNAFESTSNALQGNRAIQAAAVGDAASAARGVDVTLTGYEVDNAGQLVYNPQRVQDNTRRLTAQDIVAQRDLAGMHPHIDQIVTTGFAAAAGTPERENARTLVNLLRNTAHHQSGASAEKQAQAREILQQLAIANPGVGINTDAPAPPTSPAT